MAYCRWSSDNWKSDVYVFESDRGVEIHVAGMRYLGEAPQGDYFDPVHFQKLQNWLEETERIKIGGPSDGHSYVGDYEETILTLERLKSEGYHVPSYVIEDLIEDMQNG